MSDLFDSSFDENPKPKNMEEAQFEEFFIMEKQKAQMSAQLHEFNDMCWEKCMDKPGSKIDSRTETCLSNCVDRFIDVSMLITNRFAQLLQKQAGL